jgi:phosphoesterase RecJ-like protein
VTPSSDAFAAVAEVLLAARTLAIVTHVDPDGDAVGSTLGLAAALRGTGPDVTATLDDDGVAARASVYAFLPGSDDLVMASGVDSCQVLVSLDAPTPERLGRSARLLDLAERVVVIDHHPDARPFGDVNLLSTEASSVGELVWQLLPYLRVDPTPDISTCLYVALMTDTGRFQHANTTAATLRTAAEMITAGADPADVARAVYNSRSAGALVVLGRVLERVTLANDGRVAYSWVTPDDLRDTDTSVAELEDAIDWVRMLEGPDVVLLAKPRSDETRLSLRAKGDFDVAAVARSFGGGGHHAAAGVTLPGGLEEALATILPALPGAGE